jgi:hypothetical protein
MSNTSNQIVMTLKERITEFDRYKPNELPSDIHLLLRYYEAMKESLGYHSFLLERALDNLFKEIYNLIPSKIRDSLK